MDLFNNYGSAIHKSIINKKVKLSTGQGFEDITDVDIKRVAKKNKLNREIRKINFDYEIFNALSFEIIYDRSGENISEINHVPFSKVRYGIQDDEAKDERLQIPHFWVSNDWKHYRKNINEPEYIRKYDGTEQGRQLYVYSEYNPGDDGYYPIPSYSLSFNYIELDYEISKFHLNQVKQGYAPSYIINFSDGVPSNEEKDVNYKNFKKNFRGTDNAGNILLTYSEGKDNAPVIAPFESNDSDDRFAMLMDQIEKYIVIGSEIPPQLLILTPGKLASTDERKELLREYQMSYISPVQTILEEAFNDIFDTEVFRLKKYEM